jgi:hypothetical protein
LQAQLALAAEVGEDGGFGDAQALRDLQRGGALEAFLGEDFLGYGEQALDALAGFFPARGAAGRGCGVGLRHGRSIIEFSSIINRSPVFFFP